MMFNIKARVAGVWLTCWAQVLIITTEILIIIIGRRHHMRPQAILLAMVTMKKATHGFLPVPMSMVLRLAEWSSAII